MRFKLHIKPLHKNQKLLFNYQYPLQSWLYRLLHNADEGYATFLHQTGYTLTDSRKNFKYFTFSALQIPKTDKIKPGDTYMTLRSDTIGLIVSFYVEEAAGHFIAGLFQNQQLSLFNNEVNADFVVERVETLPNPFAKLETNTLHFKTLSPMVVSEKENGLDQYLAPTDEAFGRLLALNLVDKYRTIQPDALPEMDAYLAERLVKFSLLPEQNKIKTRKMKVKENKGAETKVVGYHNFQFELTAPVEILEVGYFGGLGRYNAMGCGCVDVVESG